MAKVDRRVALVTGANRGLGWEVCKQLAEKDYAVILTARSADAGTPAARVLRDKGHDVTFFKLDITSDASVAECRKFVAEQFGRIDSLVNNAGVFKQDEDIFTIPIEQIRDTLETNTFGALRMCQAFLPMMRDSAYGRVVNVSSGMGQLSEMGTGWPSYRIAKVALNGVTKMFAEEFSGSDILINAVCPGWVRTDMGGPNAELSIPQGADTIVWAATLPEGSPAGYTGMFFRERKPISW